MLGCVSLQDKNKRDERRGRVIAAPASSRVVKERNEAFKERRTDPVTPTSRE